MISDNQNSRPEATGKFVAATFEHDTARPVDGYAAPQLHTLAVIFNVTERDNGQARALQPHEMFVSQRFVTAFYRSELAMRLERSINGAAPWLNQVQPMRWEYVWLYHLLNHEENDS